MVQEDRAVFLGKIDLEGMREGAFQPGFPTGALVMQIRAPAIQLAGGIDPDPFGSAHNADERPLFQHFTAPHAGSLRNMLDARFRFFYHEGTCRSSPVSKSTRAWGSAFPFLAATAFVLLARNGQVAVWIVFDLHVLAALLLGFLIGIRLGAFTFSRSAGLFQGGF